MRKLSSFLCSLFGHEPVSGGTFYHPFTYVLESKEITCKRCGLRQSELLLGD